VEEATSVAVNFLGNNQKSAVHCAKIAQRGNDTLLYVFNTDKAFVVVSATKKTIPILAYSEEGVYNEQSVIPPVAMWLNNYQQQIAAIKNKDVNETAHAAQSWKEWLENGKKQKSNAEEVAPFLRSKWGQGRMYNYYCPKDDSSSHNGRAVTGCVATAMAQLMYYFRFPQSGAGSYTYQHPKYGTLSADFASAHYNYAEMCDVPTSPNAAISLLMSHCGIAVDMLYGYNSSGMYNHKAAYALKTHFKFSPQTQYVFRDSVTMNWDSLIVMHLDKKIPLYYAGWSQPHTNGHAFICDGYRKDEQGNYYFHFDFGWDGTANGYFYTDNLVVSESVFNLSQELVINAYPDTLNHAYPQPYSLTGCDTLTSKAGSFTDGSGIFQHNIANRDFTWVILPDADTIQSIRFSIDCQLGKQDTLFIETNDPLCSNFFFTDTSAAWAVNIIGKKITVRLKTLSGEDAMGIFHASYACVFPAYCAYEAKIQAVGTLSDGSGNKNYNNLTYCEKRIILPVNYSAITIYFKKFETEEGKDFLYIYDFSKEPKELLLTLSGNKKDSSYTFNTRTLSLIFETDERNTFDGWELEYTAGHVGLPKSIASNDVLRVYPNPTTGQLTIDNGQLTIENVEIYNILGQKQKIIVHYPLSIVHSIDVSHLAKGMYYLRIAEKTVRFVKM